MGFDRFRALTAVGVEEAKGCGVIRVSPSWRPRHRVAVSEVWFAADATGRRSAIWDISEDKHAEEFLSSLMAFLQAASRFAAST